MNMYIPSCFATFLSKDSNGNLYISGNKEGTASQNITMNGSVIGTIPITTKSASAFVLKLSSSDTFSWVSTSILNFQNVYTKHL